MLKDIILQLKKIVLIMLSLVSLAYSDCTKDEILNMINAGYTSDKVDEICKKDELSSPTVDIQTSDTVDSWFFKFGLGAVNISYPSELGDALDRIESYNGVDRFQIALDIGIYWSVNRNYMLGFNINNHLDNFTDNYNNSELSVSSDNFALSNVYFFEKLEDGFFIRGDIGISQSLISMTGYKDEKSDAGIGLAAGAGYCFNLNIISIQTELLLTSYKMRDDRVISTQLLVSLVF